MRGLEHRYVFTGYLRLLTGLHIECQAGSVSTDSPVIRTSEGLPFIPGSSFKGAFRSTVEKLAAAVPGIRTCALIPGEGCPGAPGGEASERAVFGRLWNREKWDEATLLARLQEGLVHEGRCIRLCNTCWLFGSPYSAARIIFSDMYPVSGDEPVTQIRDGVGIDRDSERAVEHIKYDYEVVDSGPDFFLQIILDNPTPTDLGLTCLGLAEFMTGLARIGGLRSRGLGNCRLHSLEVFELDLRDPATRDQRLKDYLLGKREVRSRKGWAEMTAADRLTAVPAPEEFVARHILRLLEGGGDHAEAAG